MNKGKTVKRAIYAAVAIFYCGLFHPAIAAVYYQYTASLSALAAYGTISSIIANAYVVNIGNFSWVASSCIPDGINFIQATGVPSTDGCWVAFSVRTPASTTSRSGFSIPQGTAPNTPQNGDVWTTSAGLFAQINGSTVGPFISAASCPPATTIALGCVKTDGSTLSNSSGAISINLLNSNTWEAPTWFKDDVTISATTNADFVIHTGLDGYGTITTQHSGNTFRVGNSHSGVADSAIAFNSNEISVGNPYGIERGALGVHAFGDGTFETFWECSNDPVGVSMNPPTQCGILQTGYISPYGYAQRPRIWLPPDGTILTYDASDNGTGNGIITAIFPTTAANGVIFPKGLRAGSSSGILGEMFTVQALSTNPYAGVLATASGVVNTNGLQILMGGNRASDCSFSSLVATDESGNNEFAVRACGEILTGSGGGFHFFSDNVADVGSVSARAAHVYVGTGGVISDGSVVQTNGVLTAATTASGAGQFTLGTTTAASANTGSSGALPAQAAGYWSVSMGGTTYKIPYFNN